MYSSLGYMYTLWWWFRLIVTIMGERNVYTKDAQKVRVIGLNRVFRSWKAAEMISGSTCHLGINVSLLRYGLINRNHQGRENVYINDAVYSSFSDGCYRLMCTLRVNGLHVRLLEGIWWDEDGWYSVPPYWAILKKVVSTVFSTFSAMWLED